MGFFIKEILTSKVNTGDESNEVVVNLIIPRICTLSCKVAN